MKNAPKREQKKKKKTTPEATLDDQTRGSYLGDSQHYSKNKFPLPVTAALT